ncbi:hypothetical protein GN956_G16615 [Arapaima gigas]
MAPGCDFGIPTMEGVARCVDCTWRGIRYWTSGPKRNNHRPVWTKSAAPDPHLSVTPSLPDQLVSRRIQTPPLTRGRCSDLYVTPLAPRAQQHAQFLAASSGRRATTSLAELGNGAPSRSARSPAPASTPRSYLCASLPLEVIEQDLRLDNKST